MKTSSHKKILFHTVLLFFFLLHLSIVFAKTNLNANIYLSPLIEELLNNNPELKSLVEKINAADDRVSQAAWIEDPRIGVEASNIPVNNASLQRTPMTGIQLYLRQSIPFPTKLSTKKKASKSQRDQIKYIYLENLNQLVSQFKQTYYEYAYTTNALVIHQKNKRRLDALTNILEARYTTGNTPQQDVLKTKLESSKISDNIIQLTEMKNILLTRLNTLLARDPKTPIKSTYTHSAPELTHNLGQLLTEAKINRPWLLAAEYQTKESEFSHSLAKQELLPDFDFSVGYRFRDSVTGDPVRDEDFVSAGVSLNIPFLWTAPRHSKQISESKHNILASENKKNAVEQEVVYQVSKIYHDLQMLKSQIHLYQKKLVPEAQSTVNASLSSYEAGEADYMSLISSQLTLFQNELTLCQHRFDYAGKFAVLESAVGKPL